MSDHKEDKSMSASPKPQPINPYEVKPEIVEKLLKMARRMEYNEEGAILLDRNDPRDRLWYGDEDEEE